MFYTNRRANAARRSRSRMGARHAHRHGRVARCRASPGDTSARRTSSCRRNSAAPTPRMWAPDVVRDEHRRLPHVPDRGAGRLQGLESSAQHRAPDQQGPAQLARRTNRCRSRRSAPSTRRSIRLPAGGWRMYYNNETDDKAIWYADSPDLESWTDRGKLITRPGRRRSQGISLARQVLADHGRLERTGGVRSDDGERWTRQQGNLLESPGKGADDQVAGQHADVVVNGDRAWLFYFTHPGRKPNAKQAGLTTRRVAARSRWWSSRRETGGSRSIATRRRTLRCGPHESSPLINHNIHYA